MIKPIIKLPPAEVFIKKYFLDEIFEKKKKNVKKAINDIEDTGKASDFKSKKLTKKEQFQYDFNNLTEIEKLIVISFIERASQ